MDPSYNNSFGQFGSDGGGTTGGHFSASQDSQKFMKQPTVTSGNDVVLDFTSSGGKKKHKAFLIIGLFLFITVIVMAVLFVVTGKRPNDSIDLELVDIIKEYKGDIDNVFVVVENIYGSKTSLNSFMLIGDEYSEGINTLKRGYYGLEEINKRINGIQNFDWLDDFKEAMAVNLPKYKSVVNITVGVLEVFESKGTKSAAGILQEYSVPELASYIDDYFSKRASIIGRYGEYGCEQATDSDACISLESETELLMDKEKNTMIFKENYEKAAGGLVYRGEGSIEYYFNSLYAEILINEYE